MPSRHDDTQRLYIAERSRKAKDMRVLGYTYPQIADELGVSMETVRNDLKRYMDTIPREHAEQHRALQLEQLEMVMRKLAPKVAKGDLKAMDMWLRTIDRISKLTGTDQPAEDNSGETAAREDLAAMMKAIRGSVD